MFEYVVIGNGTGYRRSGFVMAVWDNTLSSFTDNSTPDLGGSTAPLSFRVAVLGGNVELRANATSGDWTVKVNTRITF